MGTGTAPLPGGGGPSRPPPRASVNLVPLLLTGVSLHPPRHPRAVRQAPLPMFRCPGHARTTTAPAGSSLITLIDDISLLTPRESATPFYMDYYKNSLISLVYSPTLSL